MTRPNVLWVVSDHQAFANRNVESALFPLQTRLRALGTEFRHAYTVLLTFAGDDVDRALPAQPWFDRK